MCVALALEQARTGARVAVIAAAGSQLPPPLNHIDLGVQPGVLVPVAMSGIPSCSETETIAREEKVFGPVYSFLKRNHSSFDIIHNHCFDYFPLVELNQLAAPLVHTLHLPPNVERINQGLKKRGARARYCTVSANSAAQYRERLDLPLPVIYNGVDFSRLPFSSESEDYFLWAGRISPEKGLHSALELVIEHDGPEKLLIAGRVYDNHYYDNDIKHLLDHPKVTFLGFTEQDALYRLMSKAKAFLFPIAWDEPFGLVMLESLAAGTPVITFKRGAAAEIVEHQKTGIIAADLQQMRAALDAISSFDRYYCRRSVENKFSVRRMTRRYWSLYQGALTAQPVAAEIH